MLSSLILLAAVGAVAGDYMNYLDAHKDALYNSAEDGIGGGKRSTNCTCGVANKDRVVGGRETQRNEFPLMAALVAVEQQLVFCGATIITQYHAISAAHCFVPFQGTKLGLLVGEHDITKGKESKAEMLPIKAIIEHENYNMVTMENDIGIVVVAAKINFNKIVGPACLPTRKMNLEGEFVKVLGWGLTTDGGIQSSVLLKANLKVVPLTKCAEKISDINTKRTTQICAYLPGRDSCDGDSGGPLLWVDPDTNRYVLVGVVSQGAICGEDPAIYTDVATQLGWIQKTIAATRRGERTCAKER